ncbi:lecithin retinol acyltransferase family protein [Pseudomonas corrugata]|uniref:lecithin retinol acyltransferase family protein n=1 Tax=Pseudomonas corrugata TaxID=47879 RepID=UPI0028C4E003|nr:lecithin retinol acyltransferase family protein [Pseudomonas corrugata]MDU9035256.1 lecithin retinol acyltransferase family protein [Pseudomonas corrugata]MDU9040989.1 lecithin retinol acyltransferase family protein [Pseudomonas corrugata]
MSNLTARAAEQLSSLRSIALICMALITTSAFYRLSMPIAESHRLAEPRHCHPRPTRLMDVSLRPVDVEQPAAHLPIGAHLVSPRRFYLHHGIYLGGTDVVHYSGFSGSLRPGPIEVTDLERFANGKPVWMLQEPCKYSSEEIAERARSRLGEAQYRVLFNNCEHFCSWCISGNSYSAQVDACFHRPHALLALISALEPYWVA